MYEKEKGVYQMSTMLFDKPLCSKRNYLTASLSALPALKAGTLLAAISISLPV